MDPHTVRLQVTAQTSPCLFNDSSFVINLDVQHVTEPSTFLFVGVICAGPVGHRSWTKWRAIAV